MTVHFIGDSHSWMGRGVPDAKVHHIGTHTMHRIGVEGVDVARYGVKKGDVLVYVFGEIDCRCHLGRIADAAGMKLVNIVKPTVMCYCVTLSEIHNAIGASKTIVSCIVPPSDKGDAPTVPFHGTLEQRVEITQMVNTHLAFECQKRGLYFLNFYSSYALANGSLDPSKSDGLVHVAEHCYGPVREAFERLA